ncbi:hypothetical protein AXG93_2460s1000 [Marchantia polymorpha subsp. ruderalis]|uniref:Uncharacterized protein n=1 Tax=Marchantia polymorpha subsp. ruderalis TaxID=1480154 RepID=A0A176VRD2_MARPO|nr:hypothetical protein AXG93_2460s1000 [Marchantia polymorpha subsp. ruderalis]
MGSLRLGASAGKMLGTRVPRKRRWEGEAEQSQQRDAAAPNRKRPLTELCSRPKQKARRLVLPASSVETGRATERRNSPSSGEDVSARTAERGVRRSLRLKDLRPKRLRDKCLRQYAFGGSAFGYKMRYLRQAVATLAR